MKMKILVTASNLIPLRGGGERSLFSFLKRLSENHEVTVMTPHNEEILKFTKDYKLEGIKKPFYFHFLKSFFKINFQNWWWHKILIKALEKNDFDIILVQGILLPSIIDLPIKKIIFMRGVGQFAPNINAVNPKKCKKSFFQYLPLIFKIQYPLVKHYREKCIESVKKADMVISNANFLREIVIFYTGKRSLLLNSEINLLDYKIKKRKNPKKILFINPTFHKGVDIMYGIAKKLPEKEFLVVGSSDVLGKKLYNSLTNLPNVKSMGKIQNMMEAYKETYLLVNPSKCYEGFGRTPAEAMVNGIPSIVSGFGGLPEVVENSGDIIKDIFDIDQWVKKIRKYDNKEYYSKKSGLCKKKIGNLQKKNISQYGKIKKEIEKIIKIK